MINLLLADDHTVLREGLCELLQGKGKYKVVGQACDGEQVIEILKTSKPDIIVMDISMPKLNGIETLTKMKDVPQCPPVLVLSANETETNIRAALKAGAKGFISKNAGAEELEFAIDSVMKGQTYLSPSITNQLMTAGNGESQIDDPLAVLTKREVEIMSYIANGKSNREIGKTLHISTRTVDTHRSNILKKLKIKSNAELTKIAIANGLITV